MRCSRHGCEREGVFWNDTANPGTSTGTLFYLCAECQRMFCDMTERFLEGKE